MKQFVRQYNLPNLLTVIRISLIPVFVCAFYLPYTTLRITAAAVFFAAGLTDYLDGYFARYLHQSSKLGALLDPVADKLLVSTALVLLVAEHHYPFIAIPAAVIIGREIAISALREWLAELGKREVLSVNYLGKIKTFFQMFAIFLFVLFDPQYYAAPTIVAYFSLYFAAILTILSMLAYLYCSYQWVQGVE